MRHFVRFACHLGRALTLIVIAATALPAAALDLGNASVMSMQGQRLKLAVPYGSNPGERVPVMRFAVDSIEAVDGGAAPSAESFVVSQPEFRNVVYLQSREPVSASRLRLVVSYGDNPAQKVAYDITVPPLQYADTALAETVTRGAVLKPRHKRKASLSSPLSKAPKAASLAKPRAKDCGCS